MNLNLSVERDPAKPQVPSFEIVEGDLDRIFEIFVAESYTGSKGLKSGFEGFVHLINLYLPFLVLLLFWLFNGLGFLESCDTPRFCGIYSRFRDFGPECS